MVGIFNGCVRLKKLLLGVVGLFNGCGQLGVVELFNGCGKFFLRWVWSG